LITGAGGFTGRYVVDALRTRNYRVFGLIEGKADSSELLSCDLTDARTTHNVVQQVQPDVVIHLAAISFVGHDKLEEFYRVNVFGTLNLLEALAKLRKPPDKVLIASSANVYGNPAVEVIDESVCPAPINHYANSKLAMEHMTRTWFGRLPIIITRAFNYTGTGQDERFVIPKVVAHFARRDPRVELGNLDVSRDFSDVEDVVTAYIGLLESNARSEIVNVSSGSAVALREIISIMTRLAGYEIEVRVNPEFVREQDIHRLVGDNGKLKRLIGFAPSASLDRTLQRMYAAELAKRAS
jgi:nucleoside-diphosphate-sugar epimerase